MSLLETIRQPLLAGDYELAHQALLDSLYSSEALDYWNGIVRISSADSIHHTLSFISGLRFDPKEQTAHVDLETRVLTLGVDFFLGAVQSFGDLLFVLLHERGHILISMVYGSSMSAFQDYKFGNLWEDVYINNTILFLMKSDLCERIYENFGPFLKPLVRQEFSVWVAENHEWLRFHLSPKWLRLVRETALRTPFFTQKITYSEWMEIGLVVERALLGDLERKATLKSIGSGDLLGDMLGHDKDLEAGPSGCECVGLEAEVDLVHGIGAIRNDVDGNPVPGRHITPPPELPAALKQVLNSFAANECPPEFSNLFKHLNLKMKIEDTIVADLVGDVLSRKQGDEVYQGKTASFHSLHRRDMFLVAAGYDMTLWTIDLPVTKHQLKLYVDVSGSMWSFLHVMLLIHRHLSEFVDAHFQFSDVVVQVDPTENLLFSTSGTSYYSVAEHILREGYKEVIVLTDNTDTLSSSLLSQLEKQLEHLYLIQTQDGKKRGFNAIATKTISIPGLDD